MIYLLYVNNILEYQGDNYKILSVEVIDKNLVHVHIYNDQYNCIIGLVANETTINDVLQTSADMIFETLTNGQS